MTNQAPQASNAIPLITPDARYVMFQGQSGDLVPNDTNLTVDVFLRDRVSRTTERVSIGSHAEQGNNPSYRGGISADARYIVFTSQATNFVPLDTNATTDIFVRDRLTQQTERVSISSSGAQANGASDWAAISRDGRIVAFESVATNLVAGDNNMMNDIFVRDRLTGVTERVSVGAGGIEALGASKQVSLSADGRFVFFYSAAANLVPNDTNGTTDLFVRDRQTGTTERVSVATGGAEANGESGIVTGNRPAVTPDGRFVAFISDSSNLVPNDTNGCDDIFVRDRLLGTTERVSVTRSGAEAPRCSDGQTLGISDDGRYVAFETSANLREEPADAIFMESFVVDRFTGQVDRVSANERSEPGNNQSYYTALDGSGRHPVFATFASNLDNLPPPQSQFYSSVFLHDRGAEVGIVSVTPTVSDCSVSVQGNAAFSGAGIAQASDAANDGGEIAALLNAELTGASLIYRPEEADLFARINLAAISSTTGSLPGVMYVLSFKVDGVRYEVRATIDPTSGANSAMALFNCTDTSCSQSSLLKGGIGTVANDVRFAIPLSKIGAVEGSALTDITVSSGPGSVDTGVVSVVDEMTLPSSVLPHHTISIGFAPAGTPESNIDFNVTATTSDAGYYAELGRFRSGTWDVWARACFAEQCSAMSAPVQIDAACDPPPVQLSGVVSRKLHGGSAPYDVDLTSGGIECRSGGANGDYTLVFTFANPLTSVGGASASAGSVSGTSRDSNQYTLQLTGLTSGQLVDVTLTDVRDNAGHISSVVSSNLPLLVGDTTNDGNANSADIAQTKSQSGINVTNTNFREDLNADGTINSADIALAKSKSGTALP